MQFGYSYCLLVHCSCIVLATLFAIHLLLLYTIATLLYYSNLMNCSFLSTLLCFRQPFRVDLKWLIRT
jgi:hypothetical protein